MRHRITGSALVQIILQSSVLRDQHGLTIFLDHLKVIGGVDATLEEDPTRDHEQPARTTSVQTNVFAAYLKNSVTNLVEPLRVIA